LKTWLFAGEGLLERLAERSIEEVFGTVDSSTNNQLLKSPRYPITMYGEALSVTTTAAEIAHSSSVEAIVRAFLDRESGVAR
jgi:hypothetical protein